MPIAYFGTKLTDNISKTPEGYLICRNVPIARIGYQDYLPEEVGIEDEQKRKFIKNGLIPVYRSPEEVFSVVTIASAEGKDTTDLHPTQWLNTNNHASYSKGHCQNVRKGEGEFADFLVGDLFIKDAVLINKIENGQREVSCGYNHDYAITEKGIEQVNIVINHIAIVPNGRAGKEVAIRDAKPIQKKENKPMDARQKKASLIGRMLKAFAVDAEPEEVAEAAQAFAGKEKEEPAKPAAEGAKDEGGDALQQILAKLHGIETRVAKLEAGEAAEETPEAAIDALEKEITSGCCKEGEKEKGKDAELITAEVLSGVELPTNPIPGADAALSALKTMKPIIAAIADPVAKKQACDALLASVKGLMPTPTQTANYGKLLEAQRAKSADEAAKEKGNPEDLGKAIRDKFHRKPVSVR